MALDDLAFRTYALPVLLVESVVARIGGIPDLCLTEAATAGLDILEDRLFKESSTTIFDSLNSTLYFLTYSGYGIYDVWLKRRHQIILATTAREYVKSQDELLSFYLVQYLRG